MIAWSSWMQLTRIDIEKKIPKVYQEDQFLLDFFNSAIDVPCKTFKSEVVSMKNRFLLGNPDKWSEDYIITTILQHFTNMDNDKVWQKELAETDQIIALTTKVDNLQSALNEEKRKIATALATSTDGGDSNPDQVTRRLKWNHYTVKPWRLEFKGETIEKDGTTHYWCRGGHWSGGVKHDGMYCTHKTSEHAAWRKAQDERNERRRQRPGGRPPSNQGDKPPSNPPADAQAKKLALSESLRTALCTQAGLSSDVADRIWQEACRDSGNE